MTTTEWDATWVPDPRGNSIPTEDPRDSFSSRLAKGELHDELAHSLAWMVKLRWLAVIGVAVAILLAHWTQWVQDLVPAMLVAAGLTAFNLGLWLFQRRLMHSLSSQHLHWLLVLHLHVDLIALSLLVHETGGILNPFTLFCIFPIALAAILLPAPTALLTGCSAFFLFAGLVFCETASIHPHRMDLLQAQTGGDLLHRPVYTTALLIALAMTLFGVVFFIRSVVVLHRHAEARQRQHERIAHSRKRLARVGQIAAGVAHSIRNPLHGVLNCLDLLEDSCREPEAAETLELATEGLQRIAEVTNRLLTLTRETPTSFQQVDLTEQVKETLRLVKPRLQEHGIELVTEFEDVPEIPLDSLRFHEALSNILDNSIDALRGTDTPQIRVHTSLHDARFVRLEVMDSGEGVEQLDMRRVFDPFFSTKPVGEGSGLGLAIVREVVDEHGGEIQFQSTRNIGTKIRILLPRECESEAPAGGAG